MSDKFKRDTCNWQDLENTCNTRAREGWLLAHIHSQQDAQGQAWFVLLWWKPDEGMSVPLGIKVI